MNQEQEDGEHDVSTKVTENSKFSSLKKPLIPSYECLPAPSLLLTEAETTDGGTQDDENSMPGFGEFRKFKRVNETRAITPYKPEPPKEKSTKSDVSTFPTIEIEDADRFLLERIRAIPVESLESLIQMIHTYPDVGYVTMNRHHMDLVNDYHPYSYTICNYNDIEDKSNYVTISSNGLLEFYKGDADFMPLDRLLIEYKLYQALHEIPFFSYLRFWKAFMVWLKKIRRRKITEAKAKIEEKLSKIFEEKLRRFHVENISSNSKIIK